MEQLTRICAKEAALHCFICEKRKDDVHCHQRVSGHCLVFLCIDVATQYWKFCGD